MADIDIKRLRIVDLKKLSFQDSIDVISRIETVVLNDFDAVNTTEDFGEYLSFVNVIITRLKQREFNDITEPEMLAYESRLNGIKFNLSVLLRINNMAEEQYRSYSKNIEDSHANIKQKLDQTETEILKKVKSEKRAVLKEVDKEKEEINKVEHTTVTHALTLMGVFSAIITVIMSVVITSTSWLNAADESSALLGFIIPNLVVLLTISTLLALIYLLFNREKSKKTNGKTQFVSRGAMIIVVFALIISVLLTAIILANINKSKKPHIRYIISPDCYSVVDEKDTENNVVSYYAFSFEDQNYLFEYKSGYEHDGNLYFCKEHNTLE